MGVESVVCSASIFDIPAGGVLVSRSRDHNRSAIYESGIFDGDGVSFDNLLGLISMWLDLVAGA